MQEKFNLGLAKKKVLKKYLYTDKQFFLRNFSNIFKTWIKTVFKNKKAGKALIGCIFCPSKVRFFLI